MKGNMASLFVNVGSSGQVLKNKEVSFKRKAQCGSINMHALMEVSFCITGLNLC